MTKLLLTANNKVLACKQKFRLWIPVWRYDSTMYPQLVVLLRKKSFLHFNTNARFPPFYYMFSANLWLLLNGDASVKIEKMCNLSK